MASIGLVVANLGSPESPQPAAVGKYLREFLMDPLVLPMPWLLRWLLVNVAIVPRRKFASAHAYQSVWLPEGSPLVHHSRLFAAALGERLGSAYVVALGMRYGEPSLAAALAAVQDCERIVVLPLYPQFAESSYATAVQETERQARQLGIAERLRFLPPFYRHPLFVHAHAERCREVIAAFHPDYILFSFHGLPARAVAKHCPSEGQCFSDWRACPPQNYNSNCYRAQSYCIADSVALALSWPKEKYGVGFQSRLTAHWIEPFTDIILEDLVQKGVRRLAVSCPSFTADCLETLEEIEIRARAAFRKAGGEELRLVPSLNATGAWVEAAAALVQA